MIQLLIAIIKKHKRGANGGFGSAKFPSLYRRRYRTHKTRFVISNTLNVAKVVIHAGFV